MFGIIVVVHGFAVGMLVTVIVLMNVVVVVAIEVLVLVAGESVTVLLRVDCSVLV